MKGTLEALVIIVSGIIGVAILAVLVSNQAQTSTVVGSFGNAFSQALSTALSPVTQGQ